MRRALTSAGLLAVELVDDPLARALEVAGRMAQLPPDAYAAAKAGLRPGQPDPDADPLLAGWIP